MMLERWSISAVATQMNFVWLRARSACESSIILDQSVLPTIKPTSRKRFCVWRSWMSAHRTCAWKKHVTKWPTLYARHQPTHNKRLWKSANGLKCTDTNACWMVRKPWGTPGRALNAKSQADVSVHIAWNFPDRSHGRWEPPAFFFFPLKPTRAAQTQPTAIVEFTFLK